MLIYFTIWGFSHHNTRLARTETDPIGECFPPPPRKKEEPETNVPSYRPWKDFRVCRRPTSLSPHLQTAKITTETPREKKVGDKTGKISSSVEGSLVCGAWRKKEVFSFSWEMSWMINLSIFSRTLWLKGRALFKSWCGVKFNEVSWRKKGFS